MIKLKNINLLSDKVATSASVIAKDKKIRNIVHQFQQRCAYAPPLKYRGSILDGRDITSVQVKDAMFKFFITASLKIRANRRYKELKALKKNISIKEVIKSLKNRFFPPDFGVFITKSGPVNTISTISERFDNRKGSNSGKKSKFDLKIPYKGPKNLILAL